MSTISAGTTLTTALVQTGDTTGELVINTGASNTTAMTITTAGNVGIGTSSPAQKLHLSAAGNVFTQTTDSTNSVTSYVGIFNSVQWIGTSTSHPITFNTANTEQARITAAGLLQFNSGYGSVATAYGCRAWVNFNGTGTPEIRASGNVSSITDLGTGQYTVNFTTAMPDANYSAVLNTGDDATTVESVRVGSFNTFTTSNVGMVVLNNNTDDRRDVALASVAIFR
jgi:hypothetical protein